VHGKSNLDGLQFSPKYYYKIALLYFNNEPEYNVAVTDGCVTDNEQWLAHEPDPRRAAVPGLLEPGRVPHF
jgi:hypothetical protein